MEGIAAYKENKVTTQSGGRIVVLLYEGAIKFLRQAIVEMEAKHWAEKGQYVAKALDIIHELNASLDMEVGGEAAVNLRKLYVFLSRHIGRANVDRDAQKVKEAIAILEEMLQGWAAISE